MALSRPLVPLTLCFTVAAVVAGSISCTAILNPRDDVQRCGSATDCDDTGDNRYVAECRFDPESDVDSAQVDKICVAAYTNLGCDPAQFDAAHPYNAAVDMLGSNYEACPMDAPGVRGCPPGAGMGCADGLVPNTEGVCDVTADPEVPAVYGAGLTDYAGQEVRDQFCRSFYCDESFVCDATFSCVQCDPAKAFGEGGCGVVYTAGAPSCAYLSGQALTDACDGPDADRDAPKFGTCPTP